ncbi:GTP 3',8-cyclase MoaA [Eubacterium oxidoreducens]|uniref:GTP 3',8-cyclase n=1 Tax=Eubacterium oxidoreducens TaxID=1732 RepID=A0A1G6APG9_EUBOX|nr:GTP 3',8-cyclase MoaA [Eubacterium oxidoreducens]SDB10207.1 cyclic pyranopterin phosphate synthase [Eubacterium oxidoreducens]
MKDLYGRNIDYLRLSITDRCNFRCKYCMPADGAHLVDMDEILTYEEAIRVCEIMARNGLKKIKVTGGEPLVRRGVEGMIASLKAIDGIERVTMTTNGLLLYEKMEDLAAAGIDAINISLDSLNRDLFNDLSRSPASSDNFEKVVKTLDLPERYPDIMFKINCVPLGIEGQDLLQMAELAKDRPLHVRFIEMMPIGVGAQFEFVSQEDVLNIIKEKYPNVRSYEKKLGNGPCVYYEIPGFVGKIGFISAMSHKFCSGCNRIRMTSTGFLKTCLQYETGVDLREALRNNASDEVIEELIAQALRVKSKEHQFLEVDKKAEEKKDMSQIGG